MILRVAALICAAMLAPGIGISDTLVASQTVRSKTILTEADLAVLPDEVVGALSDPRDAIGMEARVALYAGRPIRPSDVGPPALIERNQTVPLIYDRGGLSIVTEGRSLSRAGAGDLVRVMNLASKSTVTGQVDASGRVIVGAVRAGTYIPGEN
ncbi:flagellar basal body P-ring formation chaperone FlgA [Tropicimonas sp.]|uniref:flagellar basal body P-ring formation chaperone FlgA n=1 Tax=Tropicimonas sp. TaxID=2067044 RepID=UPI003A8A63D4